LNQALVKTIKELEREFGQIPENRQILLNDLTTYIKSLKGRREIGLTFICTHNSRRSHIAQVWAQTAAYYFNIGGVKAYSGGTEVTAFHPNAIKALEVVGFRIKKRSSGDNPTYEVYFSEKEKPVITYSKIYNTSANPQSDFAAIMTCSSANEACPIVEGANLRIPITYDDPKEFDNTPFADEKYLERVKDIGREILFVFSNV
jgi:arsenate reductase